MFEAEGSRGDGRGVEVQWTLELAPRRKGGRARRCVGDSARLPTPGRIPRLSRLMALAIKLEGILHRGEARDYADLACLALVTRARMTQIMALLNLAPDIQEEILFLPEVMAGREPVTEPRVRRITKVTEWGTQRRMWGELKKGS